MRKLILATLLIDNLISQSLIISESTRLRLVLMDQWSVTRRILFLEDLLKNMVLIMKILLLQSLVAHLFALFWLLLQPRHD